MTLLEVVYVMLNKKKWLIILFISLTTIIGTTFFYIRQKDQRYQDSEKIVNEVRTYFMNVVGSYILNEPITYKNSDNSFIVFQGGITTQNNDKLTYYDFFADANSGEIIDIIEGESIEC